MSAFKSSNPVLKESAYQGTIFEGMQVTGENTMSVKGTLNKFGFLMLLMMATSVFSWKYAEAGNNPKPMIIFSVITAVILGFIIAAKPKLSTYLAPAYALIEGFLVGCISAYFEYGRTLSGGYSGIVIQAIGITFTVAILMYVLYRARIIKVTQKFRSIVILASASIGVFYLVAFTLSYGFNIYIPFLYQNTAIGIGFSILMVGLASMMLLVDFDGIEKGVEMGAPKYMEWYSAFGLLVTIIWLYFEILRLLAKLNRN